MQVLADEINLVRQEIVLNKQAHAGLHQDTGKEHQLVEAKFAKQGARLGKVEEEGKKRASASEEAECVREWV